MPFLRRFYWLALGLGLIWTPNSADAAELPADAGSVFEDSLQVRLAKGWRWIREDPSGWRSSDAGLEIRVQPGNMWGGANDARNLLVRPLPDIGDQTVTVSVSLTNRPTAQYEQVDLVWYYDDSHMVKLGQELVDGQLSIVMGREEGDQCRTIGIHPIDATTLQLRLITRGQRIRGEFRIPGSSDWQLAGLTDLPINGAPKISLQCYQGSKEMEHWARLWDFRIEIRPSSGHSGTP